MAEKKAKQKEENDEQNKKMFKDVKKFTFDYSGKFFTIGNLDLAAEKPTKLSKNDGKQNITKKETKNPENSIIENEKLKENNAKKDRKSDNDAPSFDKNRP